MIQNLQEAIQEFGDMATVWGRCGERAISEIESKLGVLLPNSIRDFINEFGNINLSPFQVVLAGNETGTYSCVTETFALRKKHSSIPHHYVKILSYAGVVYCVATDGIEIGRVVSWDEHYPPMEGSIIKEFLSFDDFIEWLIAEAKSIALDTRFQS